MSNFPPITHAFLDLTNSCNLACRYCFVHQNPKKIDLQTAKDAADWLVKNAEGTKRKPTFTLFGGEPLLLFDEIIKPLTIYVRGKYKNNFGLSITTNGTLLTQPRLEFMKENNFGILLSIDGDRFSQDWNRPLKNGESSFNLLESKIPLILKYFPDTHFRSTATPATVSKMFDNMMYAQSKGFKTFFTIPNCFEEWNSDHIKMLRDGVSKYTDYYIDCFKKDLTPIYFDTIERDFFPKVLKRNIAIEKNEMRAITSCKACGKCGLGTGTNGAISWNGDLYTCQEFFSLELPEFKIGSIYTGIDENKRQEMADLWDKKQYRSKECESCVLDRICHGGCIANNYLYNGDIHIRPEIYCEWDRILFLSAARIVESIGDMPKFKQRWDLFV